MYSNHFPPFPVPPGKTTVKVRKISVYVSDYSSFGRRHFKMSVHYKITEEKDIYLHIEKLLVIIFDFITH